MQPEPQKSENQDITQRSFLDLWRIIGDTPIQIIDPDEYEELHELDGEWHKTEYLSPYGDAAVVSPELLEEVD